MERNDACEKLTEFIQNQIKSLGYNLVEVSINRGKTLNFEVVIDKEGGITLDECVNFNKQIVFWADDGHMTDHNYTLDVSSPGLDRALKSDTAFEWAKGRKVEVRTCESIDSKNVITGKLVNGNCEEGVIVEEENGNTICINNSNIAKVRLNEI